MSSEIRKLLNKVNEINKNVITESSLSRVWQYIENDKPFGVISPFRREYSFDENLKRYANLKNDVRSLGYGFIELKGGFKEEGVFVNELALFIPNITEKNIVDLGIKYEQYSVIFKDNSKFVEIGTNDFSGIGEIKNNFISKGWDKNISFDSDLTKEFFSSLAKGSHRDKKFLFNIKDEELYEMIELSFNQRAYHHKNNGTDNTLIKLL